MVVVNSTNDPRRLNSWACEVDSIRLLNIEFLRRLPVPFGSRELLAGLDAVNRQRVPGCLCFGLGSWVFGLWSWGSGLCDCSRHLEPSTKYQGPRPKTQDPRPKTKDQRPKDPKTRPNPLLAIPV